MNCVHPLRMFSFFDNLSCRRRRKGSTERFQQGPRKVFSGYKISSFGLINLDIKKTAELFISHSFFLPAYSGVLSFLFAPPFQLLHFPLLVCWRLPIGQCHNYGLLPRRAWRPPPALICLDRQYISPLLANVHNYQRENVWQAMRGRIHSLLPYSKWWAPTMARNFIGPATKNPLFPGSCSGELRPNYNIISRTICPVTITMTLFKCYLASSPFLMAMRYLQITTGQLTQSAMAGRSFSIAYSVLIISPKICFLRIFDLLLSFLSWHLDGLY